jgi:hypothetical protein
LWIVLARRMKALGRSRWRPVLLCLPLLLGAAGYGLFWLRFFASPGAAVQMHAIKLTLLHALGDFAPWIGAGWLALSALLLLPLLRSAGGSSGS